MNLQKVRKVVLEIYFGDFKMCCVDSVADISEFSQFHGDFVIFCQCL